jgi:DNA ligase-1
MTFKVMLGASEPINLAATQYPLYIQPKLDGFRAVYIPGEGFISRSGKEFRNKNIVQYFKSLENVSDYALDGELYIHGQEFQHLTSTVNKDNAPISNLCYVVYDIMPVEDWNNQNCKLEYEDRLKLLREILGSQVCDFTKVQDIPTDLIEDFGAAKQLYKSYLEEGYEGIITRQPKGLYKWGRSTIKKGELLKLKPFQTEDFKITALFEGKGQFEGSLGGITCLLPNGDTVNVGSGFSVDSRQEMWHNKDSYVGKVAEVKYMEYTEDNSSLRHPIFIRIREDK